MIEKALMILLGICLAIAFYVISLYYAYQMGWNDHKAKIESEATQIIIDSRDDVLVADKEAQKAEQNVKEDITCSTILNFDLHKCL